MKTRFSVFGMVFSLKTETFKRYIVKAKEWSEYIDYLVQWANDHADEAFYGQSPVCFDEWYCCENEED